MFFFVCFFRFKYFLIFVFCNFFSFFFWKKYSSVVGRGMRRAENNDHWWGFTDKHNFRLSCWDSSSRQRCGCRQNRVVSAKTGRREHSTAPVPPGTHQWHELCFEWLRGWLGLVPKMNKLYVLKFQNHPLCHHQILQWMCMFSIHKCKKRITSWNLNIKLMRDWVENIKWCTLFEKKTFLMFGDTSILHESICYLFIIVICLYSFLCFLFVLFDIF